MPEEQYDRELFVEIAALHAQEHVIKAKLVQKIGIIMKRRGLKQVAASKLFGVTQPDVSKMLRGDYRQFSLERLLKFLVALNQDVEIVIRPHRNSKNPAALRVS